MTFSAHRQAALSFPPRHVSEEEYAAFVIEHHGSLGSQNYYLQLRRAFVEAYPDLDTWFAAPLTERVGRVRRHPRSALIGRVSYRARPYLFFLALRGYITFDWEWLIGVSNIHLWEMLPSANISSDVEQLIEEAVHLGYNRLSSSQDLRWVVSRVFLHTGRWQVDQITEAACDELAEAVRAFGERPDIASFHGSVEEYRRRARKSYLTAIHRLKVVLYHRGQAATEPWKIMPKYAEPSPGPPQLLATISRYLTARSLTSRPGTIVRMEVSFRRFMQWLSQAYPQIETFAEVTRDHLFEFAEWLNSWKGMHSGQPLSVLTKRGNLSALSAFFRDVTNWEWDDVPLRPLLAAGDLPKMPERVPRYIPEDELARLMTAIRALSCPYQRAALLIARWSGARRDEIRRLSIDCLDTYPDGTPRLRIPAGKTKRERMIPLHEEAAAAIREMQTVRCTEDRGLRDTQTGVETRYLFLHLGRLFSHYYLFEQSLQQACEAAGLLDGQGRHTIHAHRLRHTVGTQLAERGAKLHTIMKILGHSSVSMTLVYAQISDREVLKDYQAVLGPGAILAGPFAEALKTGELPASSVDWLKSNFFKTELELGRCLRLPQEGPCECDLYLTCAKFVTTPEYAPRLRKRRKRELELAEDAVAHGWQREVERHQCTIRRIEALLADLSEPIDGVEAVD
ncbi:MAG: tyrosine-type recombinase/integrase [Ktedonobacteraceae bacterium]